MISYNGNPNPTEIVYKGTSLDTVMADVIPNESMLYTVWSKQQAFPSRIDSVVVANFSTGKKLYCRDAVAVGDPIIDKSTGEIYQNYTCDMTFEVTFAANRQLGASAYERDPITWFPNETMLSSSGVPSGYSFRGASTPDYMGSYWVYKQTTPILDDKNRVSMQLPMYLACSKSVVSVVTYLPGHGWPTLTQTSGFVHQGTGTLRITKN